MIVEGNAGQLLHRADVVVARSLYEMWNDQTMPVQESVRVQQMWRSQVLPIYTAPDGSYEIEPRWREELVYWEGDRGYVLDTGWGVEPGVLYVPSPAIWDNAVPSWLRGRRDEVVHRLAMHSRHRIEPTDAYTASAVERQVRRE